MRKRLRDLLENDTKKLDLPLDEKGIPKPENLPQLLNAVNDMLSKQHRLYELVTELSLLLPKEGEEDNSIDLESFQSLFLSGEEYDGVFDSVFSMTPPQIALVVLDQFFRNTNRFTVIDPTTLPDYKRLDKPYQQKKLVHTNVEIGSILASVPLSNEYWVRDNVYLTHFIVNYGVSEGGGISVSVNGDSRFPEFSVRLAQELKLAVLQSPLIRGQIIEISSGNEFKVVDIGEQPSPILDEALKSELEKNVVNLFDKKEEFTKYGLPLKRSIILAGAPGNGKCLAKGTPVMMFDGSIKKVEDIRVGELLMGDNSTPRTVLSLARGTEMMYKVTPIKGDSYIVNESHILSLKGSGDRFDDETIDISVKDYLLLPEYKRDKLKGYRVAVEFSNSSNLKLDPYFLGLWLGDGNSREPQITTADLEVVEYLNTYAKSLDLELNKIQSNTSGNASTYSLTKGRIGGHNTNPIMKELRDQGLILNKHIPFSYKTASRADRLRLLAGLIDSDGHVQNGMVDYVTKDETLADDILFLSRSLGFAAYKSISVKAAKYADGSYSESCNYFRIGISGDLYGTPVKVPRKFFWPRKQIKNVLVTGIKVEPVGVDRYYGFEIDGNRRFLLGDFTVTHNTMIERWLASRVRGKVTTIWVTAKSITNSSHVSSVFDIARKLSPALVIMEDLDLISGTRAGMAMYNGNPLGEMLNQLDGLSENDAIVVVGSTNSVHTIDEALKERPGRFDRIYEVGKPSKEIAGLIAKHYLLKRGISESVVNELSLGAVMTGDFTGAQLVEIVKGAIFEAIHRGCTINDLCIKASRDGLVNQRKITHKT